MDFEDKDEFVETKKQITSHDTSKRGSDQHILQYGNSFSMRRSSSRKSDFVNQSKKTASFKSINYDSTKALDFKYNNGNVINQRDSNGNRMETSIISKSIINYNKGDEIQEDIQEERNSI